MKKILFIIGLIVPIYFINAQTVTLPYNNADDFVQNILVGGDPP